jgi:hypothetical protein
MYFLAGEFSIPQPPQKTLLAGAVPRALRLVLKMSTSHVPSRLEKFPSKLTRNCTRTSDSNQEIIVIRQTRPKDHEYRFSAAELRPPASMMDSTRLPPEVRNTPRGQAARSHLHERMNKRIYRIN